MSLIRSAVSTNSIDLRHQTAPSAPSSGKLLVYSKNDNNLYVKTSGGLETQISNITSGCFSTWVFNTTTTTPPATGGLRFNNATPSSVTAIFVSATDSDNNDMRPLLQTIGDGDFVYLSNGDKTNSKLLAVTGAADNATWFQFNVTLEDQSSTSAFANSAAITAQYYPNGNIFDQDLNTTDSVTFSGATVSAASDPAIIVKDSNAGSIATVTGSLDIVDSSDTIAASLSMDGSGNIELKNHNNAKILTLSSGTLNNQSLVIDNAADKTSINTKELELTNQDPLLTFDDTDTAKLSSRGTIEFRGTDGVAGRLEQNAGDLTLENLNATKKTLVKGDIVELQSFKATLTLDNTISQVSTDANLILVNNANPTLALNDTDDLANDVNCTILFQGTDALSATIGHSAGNLELKNEVASGVVSLTTDSGNSLTVNSESGPLSAVVSNTAMKIENSSPALIISDSDSTKAGMSGNIFFNGTDGNASKLEQKSDNLTLQNTSTTGNVVLKAGTETLTIDADANQTTLTTVVDAPSYSENSVAGVLVKTGLGTNNYLAGGSYPVLTSTNNIGIGNNMAAATNGGYNVVIAPNDVNSLTTGSDNIVVGGRGSAGAVNSGNSNVIVGSNCAGSLTTGSSNIVVGRNTDIITNANSAVVIGASAVGSTNSIALGAGSIALERELAIGTSNSLKSIQRIKPGESQVCDLGSASYEFKDAYLSGSLNTTTLVVKNATNSSTLTYSSTDKDREFDFGKIETVTNLTATFPDNAISSSTTPLGYVISQSDFASTFDGWRAFDGNISMPNAWVTSNWNTSTGVYTGGESTNGYAGEWIDVQLPPATTLAINGYTITVRNDNGDDYQQNPVDWKVFGSQDKTAWTELDSQTSQTFTVGEAKTISLTATAEYAYFRLAVSRTGIGTIPATALAIAEIKYSSPSACPTMSCLHTESSVFAEGDFKTTSNLEVTGSATVGTLTTGGLITYPKPFGEMYFEANATTTTISASNTWTKVAGTTTANADNQSFTHTSNRLTYTGSTTKVFHCGASFSFAGTSNTNVDWLFAIAKNGTPLAGSRARRRTDTSGVYDSTATHIMAKLNTNDYLELMVNNILNTDNINVSDMNVFLMALPNAA